LLDDFDVNSWTNDLVSSFLMEEETKTYEEAMRSIDLTFEKEAIKSELDSIMSNQIWDLLSLPKY